MSAGNVGAALRLFEKSLSLQSLTENWEVAEDMKSCKGSEKESEMLTSTVAGWMDGKSLSYHITVNIS